MNNLINDIKKILLIDQFCFLLGYKGRILLVQLSCLSAHSQCMIAYCTRSRNRDRQDSKDSAFRFLLINCQFV